MHALYQAELQRHLFDARLRGRASCNDVDFLSERVIISFGLKLFDTYGKIPDSGQGIHGNARLPQVQGAQPEGRGSLQEVRLPELTAEAREEEGSEGQVSRGRKPRFPPVLTPPISFLSAAFYIQR